MSKRDKERRRIKTVTEGGLLAALMIALSFFENSLPVAPFFPVGVKLGIANVIVMVSLFIMGRRWAFLLCLFKGLSGFLLRGPTAGLLSLSGGLLSLAVIILLRKVKGLSPLYISIGGACAHNVGQLAVAYFILDNFYVWYYLPVLILSGIVMGSVTGASLKAVLPYFAKAERYFGNMR